MTAIELKHEANLQRWSQAIRDCRASGLTVKAWCKMHILDTISFTRELRALGVGVLFANDGFNTLEPDTELHLSIMTSIAQEMSRKTSSRIK